MSVERFWDQTTANPIQNPIDCKVGPDGALYFLNWADGGSYPHNAGHGTLVKLEYTGPAEPVDPEVPVEGDDPGHRGAAQRPDVAEVRRRGDPEQHVADGAAAQTRQQGEDDRTEQVHTATGRHQAARQCEDRDPDQLGDPGQPGQPGDPGDLVHSGTSCVRARR